MANRFPKPWFRPSRQTWFVTLDGKQINLGQERDKAFRRYHEVMAQHAPRRAASADSLFSVVDSFLEWCQQNRASATYGWYLDRLQRFVSTVSEDMPCQELRPFIVQNWIDGMEGVSGGTKRNYIRAVQRAMKWAEQQGYIDRSPIAHMEKPAAGKREVVVSQEEFDQILAATRDEKFKDLLRVTWETGCRPQESLRLESRHVDSANCRWVFPASESKGQKVPRIVYMTDGAAQICQRLCHRYPEGMVFRNTRGVPWTTEAVNCRFSTIAKKIGKKYCLYHLRHTWMNRMLVSGVDALTVAVLAGHSDPSMLARTYQHLSQDPGYLKKIVQRPLADDTNA